MKLTFVSLFILLSYTTVYSQNISAGMRVGGSKWIDPDISYKGINPEIGVFIRAEPIKRVAFDLGFSGYNLHQDFSDTYNSSFYSDRKHDLKCKEISLAVQYNYLRLFRKNLKLYAGMDISPTYSSLTAESTLSPPQSPILTPYVTNTMRFWFFMLGFNQSFTYQVSKNINVITTVSYRGNISPMNTVFHTYRVGFSRLGVQAGVTYQIN